MVWAPDGRSIIYRSLHEGNEVLYRKPLGAAGEEALTSESTHLRSPDAVSPDGRYLLAAGPIGMEVIPLSGDHTPVVLAVSTYGVRFFPDGKWIAYDDGNEVFLRAFSAAGKSPGAPRQVSTSGGSQPRFRRDGKEIFFRKRDGSFRAMEIAFVGDEVRLGVERPVFGVVANAVGFDITGDGQRIVMGVPTGQPERDVLNVVQNWVTGLK